MSGNVQRLNLSLFKRKCNPYLCCLPLNHVFFAHSKVRDLDVSLLVQHNVVQLEVSVDNTQGVKEDEPNLALEIAFNPTIQRMKANKLTAISAA